MHYYSSVHGSAVIGNLLRYNLYTNLVNFATVYCLFYFLNVCNFACYRNSSNTNNGFASNWDHNDDKNSNRNRGSRDVSRDRRDNTSRDNKEPAHQDQRETSRERRDVVSREQRDNRVRSPRDRDPIKQHNSRDFDRANKGRGDRDRSRDRERRVERRTSRDRYGSRDGQVNREKRVSKERRVSRDRHVSRERHVSRDRDARRVSRDREDRHRHKRDRKDRERDRDSKKHRSRRLVINLKLLLEMQTKVNVSSLLSNVNTSRVINGETLVSSFDVKCASFKFMIKMKGTRGHVPYKYSSCANINIVTDEPGIPCTVTCIPCTVPCIPCTLTPRPALSPREFSDDLRRERDRLKSRSSHRSRR